MPVRVFLSSTFEDLFAHRQAVHAAVHELGMVTLDVTENQTRPRDIIETSQLALRAADLFIGIYASYYGDVLSNEQLSLTEQVYVDARRLQLPCYLYLVDPREPWAMDYLHLGFRGAMMRMFLDRLRGHQGVLRYFTTPSDLSDKVIFDLARFKVEAQRPRRISSPSLNW